MDITPPASNAPLLEPVLRRLRQRIRRVLAIRGALVTAVTALAGLLVLAALDFAVSPLPSFVRWMCPFVWAAAVGGVATVWWWLPLRRPLELVRIARWLETRRPDLDERVSTVLEVSAQGDSGMSSQLLDMIAREAVGCLGQIDPQAEVSVRLARRWLWPVAALSLVWAVLFVLWPGSTARHVVRVLVPGSNLGTSAGRIAVTPGSVEVFEGDALQISARHSAGSRTDLEVVLHLADGTSPVMPMDKRDNGSVCDLGRASRGFDYEVRAGRETSDRFRVTVWPQPHLAGQRVRLEFPAYTGWPAREQALGEGITALTGTKVELRSKLNTPVDAVRLEIDGATTRSSTLERAADGGTVSSRWSLDKPGRHTARLILKHRLGREFEAANFTVESKGDTPPEVKWLGVTRKDLRLRPDDRLEMGYEVTDDVGLGAVRLEVQPEHARLELLPVDMPPRIGRGEPPVWRDHIRREIGALVSHWPQSRVFQLRMRAEDSRPADLGGPGVGTSEWIVVRIDDGAESLARQEVFSAHSDARETIDKAREMVREAREKIERRRPELSQEKVPEEARKELAQAREQLATAHEDLGKLAERMEESVHASKVPEVKQAAETVEQSREKLENAPLQDTSQQRDQSAAAARNDAEKAERQLEKLSQELQRDEPQLQDYAHLKELEQQQRELARQAEQAAKDPAVKAPPQPWQQKQQQVAEAVRQDTQQQPQAQAASLEQQAEQAHELAAEAREQAANQDALKRLSQNPEKPDPAAKQELHKQLAHEQAAIAKETKHELAEARERQDNATANALPEAAESAEKASEDLAAQNDQAAAQEAEKAAAELAQDAKAASSDPAVAEAAADLSNLAKREKQVAEALSALEQGKPAEATAELSEAGAEEAAGLASEIHQTPQVNGPSGPMQQAAESSQKAANQAKQAAEAGSHGKASEASGEHGQAAQQLQQTAAQLDQAAAAFAQQAANAAGHKAGDQQAPIPAQPLANAFQEAAHAAEAGNQAAAASHAAAAAAALSQAADGTLRAMQGQGPPHQGQHGQNQELAGHPGSDLTDTFRAPQADPGVPPELAKLGISATDWEKIKASLKSESGASSSIALPEEYRDLVRRYFEEISKGTRR